MPKKISRPRKKAKPKKPREPRRQVPRAWRKDERGIPLTSDRPPVTFLPSDFVAAMRPPAGSPTKATRKLDPEKPTTAIPELSLLELTPFAYQIVVEAIDAADQVQIKRINPKGGPNLRYRIELAAAFLAHVLHFAYDAGLATGGDPKEIMHLALNLAVRRAQEIYGQDGA
jgi:hypothetical protein